jgi:O-methyltransferase
MSKPSYPRYYGRLLKGTGYSLAKGAALPFMRREAMRSGAHEMAHPISTYAPWQADEEFAAAYKAVRKNTLVDIWRCYELWSLVGELREIPGAIVEVGVWRGGSGALMATRAAAVGIEDTVYLCDTWEGVVKTGDVDTYYRDGKHDDTSYEIVQALIQRLGLDHVELLQGVFPDETGDRVTDESLRLVHVDVDVYQSAKDVFDWAWPRLEPGGIAVFDDYGFPACPGVTKFVNEQRGRDDRLVLHNLNGHGIVVKR